MLTRSVTGSMPGILYIQAHYEYSIDVTYHSRQEHIIIHSILNPWSGGNSAEFLML